MVKNTPANSGDVGSVPGLGRPPGEGNGNPLQYSCLGNPLNRRAWWAAVPVVTKESDMTELQKQQNFVIVQFNLFSNCLTEGLHSLFFFFHLLQFNLCFWQLYPPNL